MIVFVHVSAVEAVLRDAEEKSGNIGDKTLRMVGITDDSYKNGWEYDARRLLVRKEMNDIITINGNPIGRSIEISETLDDWYHHLLQGDNLKAKMLFMELVINSYNGGVTVIVFDDDTLTGAEMLEKVIFERYGMLSFFANNEEDWKSLDDTPSKTTFAEHLANFDLDRKKYDKIVSSMVKPSV
jgi:hypothetical protein